MPRIADKLRYHSRDEIIDALRDAAFMVDAADVPADLREVAYEQAVTLTMASQVFIEQTPAFGLAGLRS